MFDVSFSELLVIGVIALIVIGPERLPKVARTVGHLLGRAQRYVNDVKSDIRREIELDELRKFKSEMEDAAQSVHTSLRDAESSLREPAQALRQELDEAAKAATDAVSLKPANMQTPDPASTPAVAAPAPAAAAASTAAAPDSAAATESGVPAARQQENVAAQDRAAPSQPSTSGSAT
ncbi:Sec-independent protein translocase protein TatB [Bordetella genomosp. 9]|uniref:Sec-independent protein translocase protein TatB n=1 Tax=Bordetella genomosp. 9 TaxID=1416803 RepID=A0A1W6YUV6_9BORD|nr:Sec-independent protein translocase protein TatB [Bordetella genomosp. 9]ARP84866.1 twin-arginine translocase subunit TatB [Bordetella genomosp. 9]